MSDAMLFVKMLGSPKNKLKSAAIYFNALRKSDMPMRRIEWDRAITGV
jgi:hypothetical protein